MNIIIRVDSSTELGGGHLMRCLTLADQLIQAGDVVKFVCNDLPGSMFNEISLRGFRYQKIIVNNEKLVEQDANQTISASKELFPTGVDWLIVDHYKLAALWEKKLRPHTTKIMVIDDLANRAHDCDLLLDQNHYQDYKSRYLNLVPRQCVTLLGPKFLLLRQEFYNAKKSTKAKNGEVNRIFVFFGSGDITDQTTKVIESLPLLTRSNIKFDVVVGSSNPNKLAIENLCAELSNVSFYCQIANIAELMSEADLAIGAGGAAMWERCFLGLPSITVIFAKNQEQTTKDVAKLGAIDYIGWAHHLSAKDYAIAINRALKDNKKLQLISRTAERIFDMPFVSIASKLKQLANS